MATVREVLHQHTKKVSSRNIAKAFKISRTTIRKYIQLSRGQVRNTKAMLMTAIKEKWHPEKYKQR